jgi:hypothetical protein
MQAFTFRIAASFARVPSIRFIGPRDQVKHEVPTPVAKPANTQPKITLGGLSDGPALKRSDDLEIKLENWQIDAINAGGVIDLRYLKVKPIPLRKK